MSKPVKDLITNELRKRFEGVEEACVVDISGMSVLEQESLRAALREKSAKLRVIKNSMARRAWKDTVLEPLGLSLTGPCAMVTTSESLIEAAKTLVAAAKEYESLSLKEAMIEGDPNLVLVAALAKMKGRRELLAD
ncbi:MAG: 50S ribosomal protein L10, partial [Planctomycetes bacterium]|nr:50S ribosomal protein L10 [Planctomycetota bacterium]